MRLSARARSARPSGPEDYLIEIYALEARVLQCKYIIINCASKLLSGRCFMPSQKASMMFFLKLVPLLSGIAIPAMVCDIF